MIITLCGSNRFESEFKKWNERLTLQGHVVFSLGVYPSDKGLSDSEKWYTDEQKAVLDHVHKLKIKASDAILVLNVDGYVGESTSSEIIYAQSQNKIIYALNLWITQGVTIVDRLLQKKICPYAGCSDSTRKAPCELCYD